MVSEETEGHRGHRQVLCEVIGLFVFCFENFNNTAIVKVSLLTKLLHTGKLFMRSQLLYQANKVFFRSIVF